MLSELRQIGSGSSAITMVARSTVYYCYLVYTTLQFAPPVALPMVLYNTLQFMYLAVNVARMKQVAGDKKISIEYTIASLPSQLIC